MSPLVICAILMVFVNKLTADDKYCLCNRENLPQPIEMQISKKTKTLSEWFYCISQIYITFWIFLKKVTHIAYVFPKLQPAKEVVKQMSRKPRFRTPFNSQHVKGSRRIVKFAWQHFFIFYHHSRGFWVGKWLS